MARQQICGAGIIATAVLSLCAAPLQAASPTLSQQLLRAYFDTAGVCTTSRVSNILDRGDTITIEIDIEPATRASLAGKSVQDRDDWFSLHCPPEFHGVWRQPDPPEDVLVTGLIGENANEPYTLSCIEYQQQGWDKRELTLRGRLQRWLEEKLDN